MPVLFTLGNLAERGPHKQTRWVTGGKYYGKFSQGTLAPLHLCLWIYTLWRKCETYHMQTFMQLVSQVLTETWEARSNLFSIQVWFPSYWKFEMQRQNLCYNGRGRKDVKKMCCPFYERRLYGLNRVPLRCISWSPDHPPLCDWIWKKGF